MKQTPAVHFEFSKRAGRLVTLIHQNQLVFPGFGHAPMMSHCAGRTMGIPPGWTDAAGLATKRTPDLNRGTMKILHVQIQVKPESVPAFIEETLANARESVREPGVMRFDVCQQGDDSARFVLVEIYRADEDHAAHRKTSHYLRWRDAVAPMMAVPRQGIQYRRLFPESADS